MRHEIDNAALHGQQGRTLHARGSRQMAAQRVGETLLVRPANRRGTLVALVAHRSRLRSPRSPKCPLAATLASARRKTRAGLTKWSSPKSTRCKQKISQSSITRPHSPCSTTSTLRLRQERERATTAKLLRQIKQCRSPRRQRLTSRACGDRKAHATSITPAATSASLTPAANSAPQPTHNALPKRGKHAAPAPTAAKLGECGR
eukprot:3385218-Pleurochrysis_carterae.AAC.4